jgi:hypothetical protein
MLHCYITGFEDGVVAKKELSGFQNLRKGRGRFSL